jgi:teichuronic acid biosynthesis glycosyltransferase TuaC
VKLLIDEQEMQQDREPGRLKVLIFTSLFPNSVEPLKGNFVMERMRHLRPYTDLSVVAPVPYFPGWNIHKRWYRFSRIPTAESIGGFEVDHPRYPFLPKVGMAIHGLLMFLGSVYRVSSRIRQVRFDVIDAHYVYPDGFAAVLLGAVLNIPVVVSARGSDINVFPQFPTIRPLIRQVLARADALIAVSQSLKDVMVGLGCPPEKITVIGNGVDSVKFRPQPQTEMRRLLDLPVERPIVLSIGNLTENKGFHILIEAVAGLRARRPDVLLVIIGDGSRKAQLLRKIRDLGLNDNVRLVGTQAHDALSAWYSAADVFCLASATEGWPNVVMEAMACGRPVIATRVAAHILDTPALGILVSRTPEEFSCAMEQALARDWDHAAIVDRARSRGWDKVAETVRNVFSNVVAGRK